MTFVFNSAFIFYIYCIFVILLPNFYHKSMDGATSTQNTIIVLVVIYTVLTF